MTTLPLEAVKAAQNEYRRQGEKHNWSHSWPDQESMTAILTAALPFLPVQGAVKKLEETLRELITDQSEGEWDEKTIEKDVRKFSARILSALEPTAARELALEEVVETLEYVDRMFRLDLSKYIDWDGDDFNQAIFDTHQRVKKALRTLSSPDHPDAGKVEGDGSAAARDVLAERRRQIEVEGWTSERDDEQMSGQLAYAASVYALCGASPDADRAVMDEHGSYVSVPFRIRSKWPFDERWLKPTSRRRDLVKAGALIIAEIERLDRLPSAPSEGAE